MSEEEEELVFETYDQYWLDFSKLVRDTLKKVPEHLRGDLMVHLQEKSSVYGAKLWED